MARRMLRRQVVWLLLLTGTLLVVSSSCQFRRWLVQGRMLLGLYPDYPIAGSERIAVPDPGQSAPDVTKRILWWTGPMFGRWETQFGYGQQPFVDAGCPVNACQFVKDRDLIQSSDAVVFHWPDTYPGDMPLSEYLPLGRPAHQVWILYNIEPPENYAFDMSFLNGQINWTWTYRFDSDLVFPYGVIRQRTSDSQRPILRKQQQQDEMLGLVSWLASNCHTSWGREQYLAELSKHIDIDTYGGCGKLSCPPGEFTGEEINPCQKLVYTRYKFYLAFENSVCRDYVTEKLYQLLQEGVAVPVVFGGADYQQVAPEGSYVDANRFNSPRHLAEYLKAVAVNDTRYAEFKRWRQHQVIDQFPQTSLCQLCERLHDPTLRQRRQMYDDLNGWWFDSSRCQRHHSQWEAT